MDGTRDASSQKVHTSKWRISASIITEGSEEYAEGDLARLMLGHSPMTFHPPEGKSFRQMLKPEILPTVSAGAL